MATEFLCNSSGLEINHDTSTAAYLSNFFDFFRRCGKLSIFATYFFFLNLILCFAQMDVITNRGRQEVVNHYVLLRLTYSVAIFF